MRNSELNYDDGLVAYAVNGGKATIIINPTDGAFVERLFNVFYELDERKDRYEAEVKSVSSDRGIFEVARRRDSEMRELIDSIFDEPVCGDVFGRMNLNAMANGLPVWCNFMFSLMDETDTTFAREQKATNPRIAKYTAKYNKK